MRRGKGGYGAGGGFIDFGCFRAYMFGVMTTLVAINVMNSFQDETVTSSNSDNMNFNNNNCMPTVEAGTTRAATVTAASAAGPNLAHSTTTTTTSSSSSGGSSRVTWTVPEDIERDRNLQCEGGGGGEDGENDDDHNDKASSTKKEKKKKKKKVKALPNGAFCIGNVRYAGADLGLVDSLVEIFDGGTVVDLGAGMGWYKEPLLNHKTNPISGYEGFDGAMNVELKSDGTTKHMDLTSPSPLDSRSCEHVADWVMSLEVGEHIPAQYEDAFLRNIRCRARKGAIISWANPKQRGGVNHINLKSHDDAIRTVERWGFRADLEASQKFVKTAKFPWFKLGNVIVYRL